jgi:Outer membrane lipoprotein-sorting protein
MRNTFRYFLTAIFATLLFGGVAVSESFAQSPIRDVLNRMDRHYKALQTLQAGVSRRQANPQVGTSDDSSGNVVLIPGKKGRDDVSVCLNWTKPREETLLVYKGKYQLYVPGIQTSYEGNTKSQKLGKSGGGVLSLMTMSDTERKANFEVPLYEGKETLNGKEVFHIKLTPKTKQDFKLAELWVDTDGMPMQVMIVMPNGETDTLQFSGVKRNETINASVFNKIKTAPGTKVINQ